MDLVTASFLVLAALGATAAALHMVGWIPPRYRRILGELQDRFAKKVGAEVKQALLDAATEQLREVAGPDPLAALPAAIGAELEAALNRVAEKQKAEFEAASKAAEASAVMSMTRAVGVDKQAHAKIDRMMAEAILGPAMPILRQFAPGLADALEENPALIEFVINHPLFKRYVEPRIAQFLGAQGSSGGSDKNPFLAGMMP